MRHYAKTTATLWAYFNHFLAFGAEYCACVLAVFTCAMKRIMCDILTALKRLGAIWPHRLVAKDGALSRLKLGFESRWGHIRFKKRF